MDDHALEDLITALSQDEKSSTDRPKSFAGSESSLSSCNTSFTSSKEPSSFLAPSAVIFCPALQLERPQRVPWTSRFPPKMDPGQSSCQVVMRDGSDRWSRESTSFAQRCEFCTSMAPTTRCRATMSTGELLPPDLMLSHTRIPLTAVLCCLPARRKAHKPTSISRIKDIHKDAHHQLRLVIYFKGGERSSELDFANEEEIKRFVNMIRSCPPYLARSLL
eukprot:2565264-Rhodomonas_salina.1